MIVFLTLLYVGVLAIAIKVGLVKLTLWWKLSPLAWMLLLFVVLFLPMQWGAPGGSVNVYQYVVEVIPNVSGEVIEVPVEPLKTVQPGDVLFKIDPVPFQAKVDQLEAELEATIQAVAQLKAASEAADSAVVNVEEEIEVKKADVDQAAANVLVAESTKQQAATTVDKSSTLVDDLKVQVDAANRELKRQQELLEKGAGALTDVDRAQVRYAEMLSDYNAAESDLLVARQQLSSSNASLEAEQANQRRVQLQLKQAVDADLPRAKALAKEAKLAAESMIGDEHTSVADVRAQLAGAQFELEQTVIRAPAVGHVVALTLRPGQRVANFPVRSWMAFVDHDRTEVAVAIEQYALRYVQPGHQAEVTFKMFPGQIFSGTVQRIAYSTSTGQMSPSGQISEDLSTYDSAQPYVVVIDLDDPTLPVHQLPGGAAGSAAIYTESMKATHIIRRVMIRMDAWMNYIIP